MPRLSRSDYRAAIERLRAEQDGVLEEATIGVPYTQHPFVVTQLRIRVPFADAGATGARLAALAVQVGGSLGMIINGGTCEFDVTVRASLPNAAAKSGVAA